MSIFAKLFTLDFMRLGKAYTVSKVLSDFRGGGEKLFVYQIVIS